MPLFQAISERFNRRFSRRKIRKLNLPNNVQALSLMELADYFDIIENEHERAFLQTWPCTLQACIKAAVISSLDNQPRIPIQMTWVPDYDYSFAIWDAHSTKNSSRAITIIVKSPYPE